MAGPRTLWKCDDGKISHSPRSQTSDKYFELVYRSQNGSELAFPKSKPSKLVVRLPLALATVSPQKEKHACKLGLVASGQHPSTPKARQEEGCKSEASLGYIQ